MKDGDGIPDTSKFDVVYDAATGSGAGEDYKNKDSKCQIGIHANIDGVMLTIGPSSVNMGPDLTGQIEH